MNILHMMGDGLDHEREQERIRARNQGRDEAYSNSLLVGLIGGIFCLIVVYNYGYSNGAKSKATANNDNSIDSQADQSANPLAENDSITNEFSLQDIELGKQVVTEYFTDIGNGDYAKAYSLLDDFRTSKPNYTLAFFTGVVSPILAINNLSVSYVDMYQHPGDPNKYMRFSANMIEVREDGNISVTWHVTVGRHNGSFAVHLMDLPENF